MTAVIVAACSWYAFVGRQMYFLFDEWSYWTSLVKLPLGQYIWKPYQDSLNAGLFVIWRGLADGFGMTYWPYRALTITFFAAALAVLWSLFGTVGMRDRERLFSLMISAFAGPAIGNLLFGWQMAWTGSMALGLLATRFALSPRTGYAPALPLGAAVVLGPAGLGYVAVVATVALRLRNVRAAAGTVAVAVGWLVWRAFQDARELAALPGVLHLDYWRFVGVGAAGGLRGFFGSYWPVTVVLTVVVAATLATGRREPRNTHDPKLGALAAAGAVGFACWWLLLAQGRWQFAITDPRSFAPSAPRYAHVAVMMLALVAPWLLARIRAPGVALAALAVPLVAGGMAWATLWAGPYVHQAQFIRANVCAPPRPAVRAHAFALPWLRRHGFLVCRTRSSRRYAASAPSIVSPTTP